MDWIKTVQKIYRKGKRTIFYLDIIFIVVVFYARNYLGPTWEKLLPAAIIGAFGILLETLFSINDSLQEKIGVTDYAAITQALPAITSLVKRGTNRRHTVKIIASSGGTTVNSIIPSIIEGREGSVEIHVLMIDPACEAVDCFPDHWLPESQTTISRLRQIAENKLPNLSLTCSVYDYIPCVHGVLIDGQHLFLGFFKWVHSGKTIELSGAQQPHVYYKRSPLYENLFQVFETWFDNAPKKTIIPAG